MSMILSLRTCVLTLAASTAAAAPLRELAVHQAVKAAKTPTVDGRLDEPAWQRAPVFTRYRHDGGDNPQETSIRIVWDDQGITFGIVNSEAHPGRLRASVRTRDGGYVWSDDSAEFYLDPTATGYSLFKFDVNSVGTIGDTWQPDPGFVDQSWSASSARAAGRVGKTAWTLEFFVSWADLQRTPAPGDVWMFFHRRLAWTDKDAKLTTTSTSGGHYGNRVFGYIYFVAGDPPEPMEVGRKLMIAPPPWVAQTGGRWLWARTRQSLQRRPPQAVAQHYRGEARRALDRVRDFAAASRGVDAARDLAALEARFAAAAETGAVVARAAAYHALIRDGEELRDEIALQHFLVNAK